MAKPSETAVRSCAVCGRSLLTGERSSPYLSREGAQVVVCELCKVRAESAGWKRPEEVEASRGATADRPRRRRRGDLLGGLLSRGERERRRRGERGSTERKGSGEEEAADDARSEGADEAGSTAAPKRGSDEARAARSRRPRRQQVPAPPAERGATTSAAGPDVNEAVAAFNASENRRTIAGLSRSLGEPRVSAIAVRTASGATGARLTVAWELAWYQWEVGPGKRGPEIRQIAKGESIDQLHAADRKWNLKMDADGTLSRRSTQGS
jgi:hypothetical protein